MANLKMVSPWVEYYYMVKAMFGSDQNVFVMYDEEETELKIYVKEQEKAHAIAALLPEEKTFGNVTLKIEVYPGNCSISRMRDGLRAELDPLCDEYAAKLFELAFYHNDALRYTHVVDGFQSFKATYIVFQKKVVQYFNDDLGDINGKRSTLYQDIAKEIFNEFPGVYYCTDINDDQCMPF